MKVGDLVKISDVYTKYEGKVGLIIEERKGGVDQFIVNVEGKAHRFFIHKDYLEVVNENR
jgi:hypothetical protein